MEINWIRASSYDENDAYVENVPMTTEVCDATLEDLYEVVKADEFACTVLHNEVTGGHCLLGCVGVAYGLADHEMEYDLLDELPLVKALAEEIRSRYPHLDPDYAPTSAVYAFNDHIAPRDVDYNGDYRTARAAAAKKAAINLVEDMLKVATPA